MRVNAIAFQHKNNNIKKDVSFGIIKPEHLFINSPKYGKDYKWAEHVIKIIEDSKTKIFQNEKFQNLIDSIADKYGKYFTQNKRSDNIYFGKLRTGPSCIITHIIHNKQYAPYVEKLINFVKKNGSDGETMVDSVNHKIKYHKFNLESGEKLNTIIFVTDDLFPCEKKLYGRYLLKIESPDYESIKPTFEKIEPIYKKIIDNKKELSSDNIEAITKEIAKIHWYLSQVTPYKRGSAGIADALCKTLFESKGIQVSAYKAGCDPNMEAYVNPLDEYTAKYHSFFTDNLKPIEKPAV